MTLEELSNSLIQRGWKPFGDENVKEIRIYSEMDMECIYGKRKSDFYNFSPRKLVSKESGLWQFICENGMIKSNGYCNGWAYHDSYDEYDEGDGMYDEGELPRYYDTDYQYRVIESALKDESELESFILDNIKV